MVLRDVSGNGTRELTSFSVVSIVEVLASIWLTVVPNRLFDIRMDRLTNANDSRLGGHDFVNHVYVNDDVHAIESRSIFL